MTNIVRIACVQPKSLMGDDEYHNAFNALIYMEEAAKQGAQLICFPEGYPGPYTGPMDSCNKLESPPIQMVRKKACELGVYVVAGCLEEEENGCFKLSEKLIDPKGEVLGNYYRMQPNHPIFNKYLMGGKTDIVPGEDFVIVDTPLGKIGLLICSELFVPELSRIVMLRGADIIVAGGGGAHSTIRTRLTDTWRCVARSRAAENIVYVVMNQNMFREKGRGRACIAGPEEMLGERDDVGIIIADADLDRLEYLRTHFYDEVILSPFTNEEEVYKSRPGQNHDRRPEKYGDLVLPQKDAFDYTYMKKGKSYKDEYSKILQQPKPELIR